jgi:hypothetical protein
VGRDFVHPPMQFMLSLIIGALTRLLALPRADDAIKDPEFLVLRHQLRVLARKTGRPRFTTSTAFCSPPPAGLMPRDRWPSLLVTRKRCCAGTTNSSDVSGPPQGAHPAADHQSTRRSPRWSYPSPGRTPMGLRQALPCASASSASA